jgi:hypothetical protein
MRERTVFVVAQPNQFPEHCVCPDGTRTTLLVVGSDGTRNVNTGLQKVEGSNFSLNFDVAVVGSHCVNFSCTRVDPSSGCSPLKRNFSMIGDWRKRSALDTFVVSTLASDIVSAMVVVVVVVAVPFLSRTCSVRTTNFKF